VNKRIPEKIIFQPIGVIHSPFKNPEDIDPSRNVRPGGFSRIAGEIEIFQPYSAGLKDIDGFSHLIVLFAFHRSRAGKLRATPPFQTQARGIFSTRSPHRPNPIGMTVVRLRGRRGNILHVSGVDMLEGTPVLDIKPYTPKDRRRVFRRGWMKRGERKQGRPKNGRPE